MSEENEDYENLSKRQNKRQINDYFTVDGNAHRQRQKKKNPETLDISRLSRFLDWS